jgi:hypothetical protein
MNNKYEWIKTRVDTGRPAKKASKCYGERWVSGSSIARNICSRYRRSDFNSKREFNLTPDWVDVNIVGKPCHYCGALDNVACDRVDNSKGHSNDNCIPCCSDCNSIRSNRFTVEQMEKIAVFLKTLK